MPDVAYFTGIKYIKSQKSVFNLKYPGYFCANLFKHGNIKKIDWLILVIVFCFISWRRNCLVYCSPDHYTDSAIHLYLLCKGYEYYVIAQT